MAKKYDPRMHTAEHILNQTMDRMFGCGRCFSAHIERKKSKCDYRFGRALTKEEERAVESAVNAVVSQDLPVIEETISRAEVQKRFNLERLPNSAGETLRIIRVGEYDACPCIGDHVARTRDIGRFRITSTSHGDGVLRVRFKLGAPPSPPSRSSEPGPC